LIETPMVAILGFNFGGQLVWLNAVAARLLGWESVLVGVATIGVQDVFEANFGQLASYVGKCVAPLRLFSGLQVFLSCELRSNKSLVRSVNVESLEPRSGNNDSTISATVKLPTAENNLVADIAPAISATTSLEAQGDDTFFNVSNCAGPAQQLGRTASSLKQADAQLIQASLKEAKGNISTVAKQLKVSRGLIYRRLQALELEAKNCSKTEQNS
jgi:sigma-54 dependent transcriptional regulator, acetoin dehydrogenase operon transcriptional activator AcoR